MEQRRRDKKQKEKVKEKEKKSLTAEERLKEGKFRMLNEQLYTNDSIEAVKMFKEDPELFEDYHQGYRQQVEKWPKNPLEVIIEELQKEKYQDSLIGDFGCGEGRLELDLKKQGHKGKIYSFDVGKAAEHVIQTDISKVPLGNGVLDIGVFSLSLMGTNFPSFLREANRALKIRGKLFIAEVCSRFPLDKAT